MSSHERRRTRSASVAAITRPSLSEVAEQSNPAMTSSLKKMLGVSSSEAQEAAKLKEENHQLKSKLEATSTELSEWKARYSAQKEAAGAERRAKEELARSHDDLVHEHELLKQSYSDLLEGSHEVHSDNHELKKNLQSEQSASQKLRELLVQYKKAISSSSRSDNDVTDESIRKKSNDIFHDIQDFVVNNFRGAKFEFDHLPSDAKQLMTAYAPRADRLPKAFWLDIFKSLIAQVMTAACVPENFFGDAVEPPVSAATELAKTFEANAKPKWLITTRKLLNEYAQEALHAADHDLALRSVVIVQKIFNSAVRVKWTDSMTEKLVNIFERAQEFYRLLCNQQSHFKITMAHAETNHEHMQFIPEEMEIVNGGVGDEPALAGRPVEVSVFPAVYKVGGSSSDNHGGRTVVAKAKVVLRM